MEPLRLSSPVAPGGTIGILGGGQLGRMLALAAARLGLKTHIYSDEPDAPAFQVSSLTTCAPYQDEVSLEKFARTCQAITFEFENVPAASLEFVSRLAPANPSVLSLTVTQDRLLEKNLMKALGLTTPAFAAADNEGTARSAFRDIASRRAILKTRRLGYDGKGQASVASESEAAAAIRSFHLAPSILEQFVEFEFEASVVAARTSDGAFAAFDPPENLHGNHILKRSTVPSRLTGGQCGEAIAIARKIGDALQFVGVFAVELFATKDGRLLVNEIAPRVHNSGHWTIEACVVSQFEQHIRAIAGWPLGDPSRHSDAAMENLIGEEAAGWEKLARNPGGLHLYGKQDIRQGRKMGHVTTLSPLTRR